MISKWLEIGMCIALNVALILVIVDDSILNISGSNLGFLVAFAALGALDLWLIFKLSRTSKSAIAQEQSDDQPRPMSYTETPSD